MKKVLIFLCFLLVSFSYGQKKELRSANKFIEKGEYASALDLLESISDLLQTTDDKTKARSMFLYGIIYTNTEDFDKAVESFEQAKDIGGSNALLDAEIGKLENAIITSAIGDQENDDWSAAGKKLFAAYRINPENNGLYLYYAASAAVTSKDYKNALIYYEILLEINYEGIETKYYITEVASGNEIEIGSEFEYKSLQRSTNDYENAREEETESKYPEIIKNIALIYNSLGNKDKALDAIKTAREANPNDIGLLNTAAQIYYELGDSETFKQLMQQSVELDPNNALTYFNLGVISADLSERDAAIEYYKKSIELDPTYENSYLNLVAVILSEESSIVEEQNSLGQSASENLKYEELQLLKLELYREAEPILKSLIDISLDQEAITTLMSIYYNLGNNEGYVEMRNLLDQLDQ
ncbi:MAG: tetratricopeptide repeat protein [Candidatus Marisimplicoccus sp.]